MKSQVRALMPDFLLEDEHEGMVCGLDEVGRGPLSGPVVAACVVIPRDMRQLGFVSEIKDSKKLSEKKLVMLNGKIIEHFPHAIAEISPREIDEINILQASLQAMALAHKKMNGIDHALVDGNKAPILSCDLTTVVKGDTKSVSIAAASIIAKVHRDKIMKQLHTQHPQYGWDRNVGYPTAEHRAAIEAYGITDHHRRSFAPVRRFIESSQ